MSRQVKSHVVRSVDPAAQGITASALPIPSVSIVDEPTERQDGNFRAQETSYTPELRRSDSTNRDASHDKQTAASPKDSEPAARHRTKPVPKSVDRTLMISQPVLPGSKSAAGSADGTVAKWTQLQQRQLESALNQVPKAASDRWERIAELVPDKIVRCGLRPVNFPCPALNLQLTGDC